MHKVKLLNFSTFCKREDLTMFTTNLKLGDPHRGIPIIEPSLLGNYLPEDNIIGKAHLILENLELYAYCEFKDTIVVWNNDHNSIGMLTKNKSATFCESFALCMNSLAFKREGQDNRLQLESGAIRYISPVVSMANPGFAEPYILPDSFSEEDFNVEREKRFLLFTPILVNPKLFMEQTYPEGWFERE